MNKSILALMIAAATTGTGLADITVKVNPALGVGEFDVESALVSDMVKPRMERPEPTRTKAQVVDGQFVIATLTDGDARYRIPTSEGEYIMLFTHPGDELIVNVENVTPLDYTVTGTEMMENISKLDMAASKLVRDYQQLLASGNANEAAAEQLNANYYRMLNDFIAQNPDSEAVPYAMLELEDEDFLRAYDSLSPGAKKSPMYPLLEPQKQYVEKKMASEQRKLALQGGNVEAPNFTFNNVDGQPVSLSDFRGKWVVIDFWGTWCPWCIKGFPALKEAYAELKPKLEVLGVACNDKYEAWVNGLKKYDLPWVNVYNPEKGGGQILEDYAVEGFPTKVIVSPEGKIVNITTGEDPKFFDILRQFVK